MKLSKKRETWVAARRAPTIKGNPLAYPAAVMTRYRTELQSLTGTMAEDYRRQLRKVWKQYGPITMDASLPSQVRIVLSGLNAKWEKIFTDRSRRLADRLIESASKASEAAVKSSLKQLSGGVTIKTPVMPADLEDAVKASIALNVGLIRSIQQQFAERIQANVMTAIQTGGTGAQGVFEYLTKAEHMAETRAKIIAEDQVRKVTSAMNTERMKDAGVRKFEWIHSGGGAEPRELHVEYDGQIFSYDDPPVIDEKTGERGLPGQLINCRCVARPVIEFSDEQ